MSTMKTKKILVINVQDWKHKISQKNSFTIQVSGKRNKKLNINYKSFEKNKIDEDPVITKLVTEELQKVYTKAGKNLKVMFWIIQIVVFFICFQTQ